MAIHNEVQAMGVGEGPLQPPVFEQCKTVVYGFAVGRVHRLSCATTP